MANTVSSVKRIRTAEHRTTVNVMRRSRLRNAIRSLRRLVESKEAGAAATAAAALPAMFSAVDKAAKVGVIKKNTAARYKSRLTKRVKAMAASA